MSGPRFKVQYDLDLTPAERLKAYGLRKVTRIAVNRAARGLKSAEESTASAIAKTGATAKSIRIKVKVYRDLTTVAIVGPGRNFTRSGGKVKRGRLSRVPFRRGLRKVIRPARYAHILERGSKRSTPRPFIKPAEAAIPGFRDQVAREIAAEIENEIARQAAAT